MTREEAGDAYRAIVGAGEHAHHGGTKLVVREVAHYELGDLHAVVAVDWSPSDEPESTWRFRELRP